MAVVNRFLDLIRQVRVVKIRSQMPALGEVLPNRVASYSRVKEFVFLRRRVHAIGVGSSSVQTLGPVGKVLVKKQNLMFGSNAHVELPVTDHR